MEPAILGLDIGGTKTAVVLGDRAGLIDFHALRHSFGTNLALAGVPVKVCMDLMRHSDVNLTMKLYAHTLVQDRARALDALPDLDRSTVDVGEERAG